MERWHRTFRDQFLSELDDSRVIDLADLNARLWAWLEQIYHHTPHAGLDGLTRVMAKELAPQGIRVNGVHPTVTLTPMALKAWSDPAKAAGMMNRIPVGRFAESEDISEVILFLLSDEAAMVNGISMPIDGGYMIA